MTLWQLRCFLTLAHELHFSRAAASLGITQPTLSSHLRALERALGATLVHRTSREVRLSTAGRVLRVQAEEILALVDAAERHVAMAADGRSGKLLIGTIPSAATALMPALLRRLHDRAPEVDVHIEEVSGIDQMRRLAQGTIDIGLLHEEKVPANVRATVLYAEPYRVFLGENHPLAASDPLRCADLIGHPQILWPRAGAPTHYDRLVTLSGTASPVIEVPSGSSERAYAAAGLGLLVRPASWPTNDDAIRSVPLVDSPPAEIHLAWRHPRDNPVVGLVTEMLTEIVRTRR